jgi:hypothetical protein
MSIWYYDQTFKKVNVGREVTESDAYLYLPGPSLKYVDFDVRQPGCTAFAVNTAYPKVKPHYWVGMDRPGCYDQNLFHEGLVKFVRGTYARKSYKGEDLTKYPNTYFVDTLAVVLHLILLMGHRRIFFVGCNLGGDADYHDDRVLADDKRDYNRRLYKQQDIFLKEFVEVGKQHGVECISCTDDSPINRYMRHVPLKQAIETSRPEESKCEIKHAVDVTADENRELAESINWQDIIRDRGVMVMCDKDQQYLLDWWYENYRKWNDYPVLFVDIGMDKDGIDFCKARGSYVKMPEITLKNWFKKPFALRLTQFKRTIFMDVDCLVRGSLYDFWDYSGFTIARDKMNNFSTVQDPVNSGVIIYDHEDPLIDEWCEKTIYEFHKWHSDQTILDQIRDKRITELSHKHHWLRIMGGNKTATIYHFTGSQGKEQIKKMIGELA